MFWHIFSDTKIYQEYITLDRYHQQFKNLQWYSSKYGVIFRGNTHWF